MYIWKAVIYELFTYNHRNFSKSMGGNKYIYKCLVFSLEMIAYV